MAYTALAARASTVNDPAKANLRRKLAVPSCGTSWTLTEDRAWSLMQLAACRDRSAVAMLEELEVRHRGRTSDTALCQLCVTSIVTIQEMDAIPFLLARVRDDGPSGDAAVRCLERLSFRPSHKTTAQGKCVDEDWEAWAASHSGHSWDDVLIAELHTRGVLTHVAAVRDLPTSAIVELLERWPLYGESTYRLDHAKDVDGDGLIAMRLSEMLCARTGIFDVSPAGFPLGFPDKAWAQVAAGQDSAATWRRRLVE